MQLVHSVRGRAGLLPDGGLQLHDLLHFIRRAKSLQHVQELVQYQRQHFTPYLVWHLLEDPVTRDLDPRVPHVKVTQRCRPVRQVVCPDDTELGIAPHTCQLIINQLDEPR